MVRNTIGIFDFYDECKSDPEAHPGLPTPAAPVISTVEERGEYDEEEAGDLAELHELFDSRSRACEAACQAFEKALAGAPESVQNVLGTVFQKLLPPPAAGLSYAFFAPTFEEVRYLLQTLQLYITSVCRPPPLPLSIVWRVTKCTG